MYETTSNERLKELSARPEDLTPVARVALDLEIKKRGLFEPEPVPGPPVEPPLADGATACADHPLRAVVGVCSRCGRFICFRCDGSLDERLTSLPVQPPSGVCGACRLLLGVPKQPLPLGGWLVLMAISLVVAPFTQLRYLQNSVKFYSASTLSNLGTALVLFDLAVSVAWLALVLWGAVRFFGKRTDAPNLIIAIFASGVIQLLLQLGFEKLVAGEVTWSVGSELVASMVRASIWIPYFRLSKRVKATFVRP